MSQHHWYSALVWLLYYSFVEKCDNYSDVRKDKAANQPQIIGKRVAKDFLSWAAIVKCMYYLKNKLSNCRCGRWTIHFSGCINTELDLDKIQRSKPVHLRHFCLDVYNDWVTQRECCEGLFHVKVFTDIYYDRGV